MHPRTETSQPIEIPINVISEEGTEEGAEAVINTEPELAQHFSHLRHYWKPGNIGPCQQKYWRTYTVK